MKRAAWRTTASSGLLMLGLIVTGSTGCSGGDGTSPATHLGAKTSALADGPDLVITDIVVPPSFRASNYPYSQAPKAKVTVCNQGTASSDSTEVTFYVSMDDVLTPMGPSAPPLPVTDQARVGNAWVPNLYPSQCATFTTDLWPHLPPDANGLQGAYYFGAIVDEYESVSETREDNNAFIHGLVGVGDKPDLVITDMKVPPSLRTGWSPSAQPQTGTVTVCNQGTTDSTSTMVRLYLSMDDELTSMGPNAPPNPPMDQSPLGFVPVPPLYPGRCATVSTQLTPHLPPDAQGNNGAYYVGGIVDEDVNVQELREDNNTFIHGLVGVGNGSDLVITDMVVPPSLHNSGYPWSQQPKASVTVCNQGTQSSGSTQVHLYLSMDDVLTAMGPNAPPQPVTDQAPLGQASVPSLFAGQCITVSTNLTPALPPAAQGVEGAYYVGAIVDEQDSELELREDNNAFIHGLIGFGFQADLVITGMEVPPSLRGNSYPSSQTPKAKVTVCNQGTSNSSSTEVRFYISMDDTLTAMGPTMPPYPVTDQMYAGTAWVPNLYPTQCITVSSDIWASRPPDAQGNDSAFYFGAIVDEYENVQELRDDNNTFIHGLVGIGDKPDLVITDMNVPTSLRTGGSPSAQPQTGTVTVCNQGTMDSTSTMVRLYLSMDDELTAMGPNAPPYPPMDQSPLGFVFVPPLYPGRCTTVSTQLTPHLPPDAYYTDRAFYVGGIVDEDVNVQELREDNNTFIHGLVGVGNGSDLVITGMNVPPSLGSSYSSPQPRTGTVTVCNQGTQDSGSTQVRLYLSMDDTLTAMGPNPPPYPPMDQSPLGFATVPPLYAGRCVTVSTPLASTLPPLAQGREGAYYVGAIVDEQDSELELREDNNAFIHGLIGFGDRADLVITGMEVPPSLRGNSYPSSQTPKAKVTVCNQGTSNSSSTEVRFYISMDDTLTAMGPTMPPYPVTDQMYAGTAWVPNLYPTQCITVSSDIWASRPPDAQGNDSAFYFGAIVDEYENVQELRDDNNTFIHGLVGIGDKPDLVITGMNVPPSFRTGGSPSAQPLTGLVTVCNQGTTDSTSTMVRLYLSMDDELTSMGPNAPPYPPMDQSPLGFVFVPPLYPGRCTTVSTQLTPHLPPDASNTEGAYYVGGIVDEDVNVQELREDNNTFIHGLVGVGNKADLVITGMVVPPSLRSGPSSSVSASVTVCNQGTQDSGSTQVQLYLSVDDELTAMGPNAPPYPLMDQSPLGQAPVPPLFAGRCATVSVTLSSVLPPSANSIEGAYYIGGIVDEQGSEQELREDNNAFIHGLIGVGSRPDLVITGMVVPPSLRTNTSPAPTASVTVCNQGTVTSNSTEVRFYISMDDTLTSMGPSMPPYPVTDQMYAGTAWVPSLASGHCTTVSTDIWPNRPPDAQGNDGAFYFGAIVDEYENVQELREDNNTFIHGLVGIGSKADLIITGMSVPPSFQLGGYPSQTVTGTVTVCNQGTQDSTSTMVRLYLSMDDELTAMGPNMPPYPPMDQSPLGFVFVPDLAAGACTTVPTPLTPHLPPDANNTEGAYYVGAIVDEDLNVEELREDNNLFIKGLVGVGNKADLVVTALTGPSFVRVGNSFTATVTVCNQGTQPSDPSSVYLYTSLGAVLTADSVQPAPDQSLIGVASLNALNPNSCSTQSLNVSATLPPSAMGLAGAYHLGAYADAGESLVELREDNNTRVTGLIVTP
ncbi:hypothetical protein LXT21_03000 [Myxococcus sp. K38C18041901]|uniref:CARDB domain-containing protein n=1 Tax=Myxococcus guangdongensis TaxID=2906760 RepID=UPI0020A76544|nr:CARDB domain-containing protein [Myxococcus guangdongensis]MCP3057740.1 hypothetical protein [Myxococcus guangdongensis]